MSSKQKFSEHPFPPSVQSDLWNYLRPEQQEFLKPILRVLKKPAQEELCVALIDYLETGIPEPPVTFNLGVIFMYIIHGCEPKGSDPADRKFLYPLHEVLASSQRDEEGPSGGFAPSAGKTGFASFPHGYSDTGFQPGQSDVPGRHYSEAISNPVRSAGINK